MISIEEAQRTILEHITPLEAEKVSLFQGLGRVTPEDHIAPWDIPAADNSAMDGYAFSHATLRGKSLRVVGFLPAGETHSVPLKPGEAIKIMTGALLPLGCDTVVPLEDVEENGKEIRLKAKIKAGANVRLKGEDIRNGDAVISAGALLRPQEIGMLSAMGTTSLSVYRRARVAILATGDELLEPGSTPAPGKIINSNSYSLAAQVLEAGGDPVLLGIAPDDLDATCDKIRGGLNADFLVITGGVSVGERDFVKVAIEKLGGAVTFWRVRVKPGKPLPSPCCRGSRFLPCRAIPSRSWYRSSCSCGRPCSSPWGTRGFSGPPSRPASRNRRKIRGSAPILSGEWCRSTAKPTASPSRATRAPAGSRR